MVAPADWSTALTFSSTCSPFIGRPFPRVYNRPPQEGHAALRVNTQPAPTTTPSPPPHPQGWLQIAEGADGRTAQRLSKKLDQLKTQAILERFISNRVASNRKGQTPGSPALAPLDRRPHQAPVSNVCLAPL